MAFSFSRFSMTGHITLAPGPAPGLLQVHIHHSGRLNAMSRAMWRQLRAVFLQIHADPSARCVLIAGEGAAFCAGGDISEYPGFRFDSAQLQHFHEQEVWGALSAMLDCDVPIVAAIAGPCMGAGVEIASCCDIRIAADDARFGAPIAKLGFPMAPREAQLVAGALGEVLARQMLLEAASFDADVLWARGFLSRVVAPEQLLPEALQSAQRIAALAPQAARLNKRTLRALKQPFNKSEQAQTAIKTIATKTTATKTITHPLCDFDPYAYADSAEHREGITAFLEKRPAAF